MTITEWASEINAALGVLNPDRRAPANKPLQSLAQDQKTNNPKETISELSGMEHRDSGGK